MQLDKIHDILRQVDEETTLSYIYNLNMEQENQNIMNEALKKSNKKLANNSAHMMHISVQKKLPWKLREFVSTRRDSNPRPSPWEGNTPPLSHSCNY